MQVCRGGDEISFTNMGLVAEMVLAQVCVRQADTQIIFPLTLYFQPEDGRIRLKHVVGELLYLQI